MTTVCPYLGTVSDREAYMPVPSPDNGCYYAPDREPASIPLQFQAGYCLTARFEHCSRYQTAEQPPAKPAGRSRLVMWGALGAVLVCGCLLLAALGVGGWRVWRLAQVTPTATETALPSPTNTLTPTPPPTATPTASPTATPTATFTPEPTATFTPTATMTPPPPPTNTPMPTPTRPRPTATRPRPTSTRPPTATPRPTGSPTPTRTPTATPTALGCTGSETMTFIPTAPVVGQEVTIEVKSTRGHTDISLDGPDDPEFKGVKKESDGYYYWRWKITYTTAGSRTYRFKIQSGAFTCKEATVTVVAATYGVTLTGDTDKTVAAGATAEFAVTLKNTGNIEDKFDLKLAGTVPGGWAAQLCVGTDCKDFPGSATVTVAAGGTQALTVKLTAPSTAQAGDEATVTLTATSQADATATKDLDVTATVQ